MRIILYMLRKEFRQIFRNKAMLPIIFVAPLIQLLILSNAATYEVKNLKIYFNDFDQSTYSKRLKSKFYQTDYFKSTGESTNRKISETYLEKNEADIVFEIPPDFQKDLVKEGEASVFMKVNAIDGMKAGLSLNYANNVLVSFMAEINQELAPFNAQYIKLVPPENIQVEYANWYNEKLDYKIFMVPGLLVMLVTLVGGFLSSMNIVKEKEMGTIEQINVTPIRKHHFIIGKLLPFWLLAFVVFTIGLIFARYIFNVPIMGSLLALYGFTAVYLFAVLGLGLFISTITDTQQQAMFISWFFLVIFILMSGLFTAIENMPVWAQRITLLNPLRYYIEVIRMVLLKGAGFEPIKFHFLYMLIFGFFINLFAIWRYRKATV